MTKWMAALSMLAGAIACFAQSSSVAGNWKGVWTSPSGAVFSAEMTLEAGSTCRICAAQGEGSVRGTILWTLRRAASNKASDDGGSKNTTGTEYVSGELKSDGLLILHGVQKDDAHDVTAAEQYRLALADNGQVIGGLTRNNGSWTGQFILMRVQP